MEGGRGTWQVHAIRERKRIWKSIDGRIEVEQTASSVASPSSRVTYTFFIQNALK